jgi:hypothetical protein
MVEINVNNNNTLVTLRVPTIQVTSLVNRVSHGEKLDKLSSVNF